MDIIRTLTMPVQIDGETRYLDVDVIYHRLESGRVHILAAHCDYLRNPSNEQTYQIHNQALQILGDSNADKKQE